MNQSKAEIFYVCGMPTLSRLNANNMLIHTLFLAFNNVGPEDPLVANLCRNFIRLVDQLVSEYENGRHFWLEMIKRREEDLGDMGVIGFLFILIGHLETSVVCLHRCLLFAKTLENKKILKLDRNLITYEIQKQVKDFRDAIQHWDERITGEAKRRKKSRVRSRAKYDANSCFGF